MRLEGGCTVLCLDVILFRGNETGNKDGNNLKTRLLYPARFGQGLVLIIHITPGRTEAKTT
jgi:hypothetical protein